MAKLKVLGVLGGQKFSTGLELAEFRVRAGASGPDVLLISHTTRENIALSVTAGGTVTVGDSGGQGRNRLALTVDGVAGSVAASTVDAARAGAAAGQSVTAYLNPSSMMATQAVEMLAVRIGGADYLLAARPAGSGLSVFTLPASGAVTARPEIGDTAGLYLGGVAALASATVGGQVLVFAGSSGESGITVLRMTAGGGLTAVNAMGPAQLVPLQTVTALRTVEAGGASFLIAAASGSSSLTVFRLSADGRMQVTDHLVDTLETRFQGVRCLEVVTVGDHVFVLAAGADDGLSLFALTPDGRLVHLETLADSAGAALANVTALTTVQVGGTVQVLTVSGAEPGLTILNLDISTLGQVITGGGGAVVGTQRADLMQAMSDTTALQGGAGDDILIDAAGSQMMTGGAGADLFVMTADGEQDTILDFDPARDRIDLSAWPMFRGVWQLTFTPTRAGGVLSFGAESLVIFTANGAPLTLAQVQALRFGTEALHVTVVPGVAAPENPARAAGPVVGHGLATDDLLTGSPQGDLLYGHDGNDTLWAGTGADTLYGGAGLDVVSYQGLDAALVLNLSRPAASSAEIRNDQLEGIEGYRGTAYGDQMTGGAAPDWLEGWGGADSLAGRGGGDSLFGGDGADVLTAEGAGNFLWGGSGNDVLSGGSGADFLAGDEGSDTLYGGGGNDILHGGTGDWLYGGAGNDVIVLSSDGIAGRAVAGFYAANAGLFPTVEPLQDFLV